MINNIVGYLVSGIKEVIQTNPDIERLLWTADTAAAVEKILHWNKDTRLLSERVGNILFLLMF